MVRIDDLIDLLSLNDSMISELCKNHLAPKGSHYYGHSQSAMRLMIGIQFGIYLNQITAIFICVGR